VGGAASNSLSSGTLRATDEGVEHDRDRDDDVRMRSAISLTRPSSHSVKAIGFRRTCVRTERAWKRTGPVKRNTISKERAV
jgi:hypothetical protein